MSPTRRGDEALVAAADGPILPARQDGLDEAELAEAPLESVELGLVDPTRIRRVGPELVDRHVLDRHGRRCASSP